VPELGAFWLMRPWLSVTPGGDGHPVLVLPGLLADDSSTRALRGFLNSHGYKAHGWKLGRNVGLRGTVERDMLGRIDELFERYRRRKVRPRRLEPGWPLCPPARQERARQGALHDQSRQSVCRFARNPPTPGAPMKWRAATRSKSTIRSAARWPVLHRCRPPRSSAAATASAPGRRASTRTAPRARTSRSMAATAVLAIIRRRSTPLPTASPSPKANGREFDRRGLARFGLPGLAAQLAHGSW